jgi:hypothetical protein
VITKTLRWQLLLPPVVVALTSLVFIYGFDPQGTISERHNGIGVMILLFIISTVAIAVVVGALLKLLPVLINDPKARSVEGVLCASIGIGFIALWLLMIIMYV